MKLNKIFLIFVLGSSPMAAQAANLWDQPNCLLVSGQDKPGLSPGFLCVEGLSELNSQDANGHTYTANFFRDAGDTHPDFSIQLQARAEFLPFRETQGVID